MPRWTGAVLSALLNCSGVWSIDGLVRRLLHCLSVAVCGDLSSGVFKALLEWLIFCSTVVLMQCWPGVLVQLLEHCWINAVFSALLH